MADQALSKNFNFEKRIISEFGGYDSTLDPTKIAPNFMVEGSLNVYKKINGNIANRPGMKLKGTIDATASPISSSFNWNTSWGDTRTMVVTEGKLKVDINDVYYDLLTSSQTRWVFDSWNDPTVARDKLLMVKGDNDLLSWTGGITGVSDASTKSGVVVPDPNTGGLTYYTINNALNISGTYTPIGNVIYLGGSGYKSGDIVSIGGGTGATFEVLTIVDWVALTVGITAGHAGSGYTVGDILYVYPSAGSASSLGAVVRVATITGGGGTGPVGTVTLIYGGNLGYPSPTSGFVTKGGTGTGCQIDILTVGSGSVQSVLLLTLGSGYSATAAYAPGYSTTALTGIGSGMTAFINSVYNGSVLTISGFPNWQKAGFEASIGSEKKLMINGTEYTYTNGETTTDLIGITPTLSGVTSSDIIIQSVITHANTPISTLNPGVLNIENFFVFSNDFIKVIRNQLYVGSYSSRFLFISSSTDFTDFSTPAHRVLGDPILIQFGGKLNGIGLRAGAAVISYGNSNWEQVTFQDVTIGTGTGLVNQPVFNIYPTAENCGCYAHEFISNDGNNIVYLSKDQQVRTLGDFNDLFVQGYPSLSLEVNTELSTLDFTGGSLSCIGEFTYLTAPAEAITYVYQVRRSVQDNGTVKVERLWHAPMTWNITGVSDIDGTVYGFSNVNPQIYQLWNTNQWHDDTPAGSVAYTSTLAFAYRNIGDRTELLNFDKTFSEGYLSTELPFSTTSLNITNKYNYNGATYTETLPINSIAQPGYTF